MQIQACALALRDRSKSNSMKKFYTLIAIIFLSLTSFSQTYYIYTAKKSGSWNDMTVWNIGVRGDGVHKSKVVIPAAFTVSVTNAVNSFGLGDADINILGRLNILAGTHIALSANSTVELSGSGQLLGTTNTQLISIGGVVKYNGQLDGTETGPSVASSVTGISPNGFYSLAVLATELTKFTVVKNQSGNELQWSIASESTNSYFNIEKSYEGTTWSVINSVNALNTSEKRNYSYTDRSSDKEVVYYRIKQVDQSGEIVYSEIKKVIASGAKTTKIYLAGNTLNVQMLQNISENSVIIVSNSSGSVIARKTVNAGQAVQQLVINQQGLLFVQVTDFSTFKEAATFVL
jgi:hypothetical protein